MARTIDAAAFVIVLVVVFVDTMGLHFSAPAFVPLMTSLGASADETGYLLSVRNVAALVCGFWMPYFAATKGRRPAIILSCLGSAAGYLLQGFDSWYGTTPDKSVYTWNRQGAILQRLKKLFTSFVLGATRGGWSSPVKKGLRICRRGIFEAPA